MVHLRFTIQIRESNTPQEDTSRSCRREVKISIAHTGRPQENEYGGQILRWVKESDSTGKHSSTLPLRALA